MDYLGIDIIDIIREFPSSSGLWDGTIIQHLVELGEGLDLFWRVNNLGVLRIWSRCQSQLWSHLCWLLSGVGICSELCFVRSKSRGRHRFLVSVLKVSSFTMQTVSTQIAWARAVLASTAVIAPTTYRYDARLRHFTTPDRRWPLMTGVSPLLDQLLGYSCLEHISHASCGWFYDQKCLLLHTSLLPSSPRNSSIWVQWKTMGCQVSLERGSSCR